MPKPVLTYDGNCSFCRMWVDYFRSETGDRVDYVPAKGRIDAVRFEQFSGAEAVFNLLERPGVYAVAPRFFEAIYRFVANHRNAGYWITRALWGKEVRPPAYHRAAAIFTRVLAFIYLIAFASFGTQARGLAGAQGLQPASVLWPHTDFALLFTAWSGVALSLVAILAKPHSKWQRIIFGILWVYYLSIVYSGSTFMTYQWDLLLLETGFLTICLPRIWLYHWLLFRLMFESGAVKLLSHDASWGNLTALQYHFWTQPLPNIVAWYSAQLPEWLQKTSTFLTLATELVLPWLIFGPRNLRRVAMWGAIALQCLIFLTGNYTFFNLLAIALSLLLWEDRKHVAERPPSANRLATAVLFTFIMIVSATELTDMFGRAPEALNKVVEAQAPYALVNPYGLFAVMTTSRHEIEIEGSNDGEHWEPYVFRYKPGPLNRAPGWVAPFQPRLDWQMWFAALGSYKQNPWFVNLMAALLKGNRPVLALLERDPFNGTPPHRVRAVLYDYRFTNFEERRRTGNWWRREQLGLYFPPVSLRGQ